MTAAPAVPTSAPAEFKRIPLSAIVRNPNNPRKVFDQVKLDELAASIVAQGVLEPILVRPVGKGYQLVAGERRWLASKLAKKADIPAMVEARTDAATDEVALLENVGRVDLSALEVGEHLARIQKEHKRSVEDLMALTGFTRTVVFQRMKLAELKGKARDLVVAGKMSASIGELIARLPTEDRRQAALARLVDLTRYGMQRGDSDDDLRNLPYGEARRVLDQELVLRLKSAPFDINDAGMMAAHMGQVPGPCGECPKRTGAQKDLYPGIKEDTCLDDSCWGRKKAANEKKLADELKADGKKLLPKGEELFDRYSQKTELTYEASKKYSTVGAKVEGVDKTWKQLLGEEAPVVVAIDHQGKPHHLVDTAAAVEKLKKVDPKAAAKVQGSSSRHSNSAAELQQKKREAAQRKQSTIDNRVIALVLAKAPVMTLESAAFVFLVANATNSYGWSRILEEADMPKSTKIDTMKPVEKVRLLLSMAFKEVYGSNRFTIAGRIAALLKMDAAKLRKRAAAAVAGTCWVCGCNTGGGERSTDRELARAGGIELKACKGGCSWVNGEKTLCSSCAGGKSGGK